MRDLLGPYIAENAMPESENAKFSYRKFDVEVSRSLPIDGLRWPGPGEATNENCLGCNRAYVDLRRLSWGVVRRVRDREASFIERIERSADPETEYEQIDDELYEDDEGLFGLDIGVATTTLALNAAGCVTCSSCNAGAYGGHHYEHYPVVGFFAKPRHVELLLHCANEAGVGLENFDGTVIVFADDIRNMRRFADVLIQNSSKFRAMMRNKVL